MASTTKAGLTSPFIFSQAERDRRWSAVQKALEGADLDCLLVPPCVHGDSLWLSLESSRGTQADGRYLTQLEDVAVVLPRRGSPIVIGRPEVTNDWIDDVRAGTVDGSGSWSGSIVEAINELGLAEARIGVSGLSRGRVTHTRANDGVVAYSSYEEIQKRLPRASFHDATDVLGFVRFVKGDEELEALRLGSAIAEAGIEALIEHARPGLEEAVLYSRVMARMLELGSEYYNLALVTGPLGGPYKRVDDPLPGRVLGDMQWIDNEVDAKVGGIIAQERQPVLLGEAPTEWKKLVELHEELFYSTLPLMAPGKTVGALMDFSRQFGPERGVQSDILMHGRGYGNDGPLLTPSDPGYEEMRDVEFQVGNAFVWKPTVGLDSPDMTAVQSSVRFGWGGNVVVTENGAVPLFKRSHGLVTIT